MHMLLTVGYLLIALNLTVSIKTHLKVIKESDFTEENKNIKNQKSVDEGDRENPSNS